MSELIEKQTKKQAIKPPEKWNVIFLNDDFTPFEFVMICLITIFNKTEEQAFAITKDVHEKGRGIVGTYSRDIAETKKETAVELARVNQHPLHVAIEPAG